MLEIPRLSAIGADDRVCSVRQVVVRVSRQNAAIVKLSQVNMDFGRVDHHGRRGPVLSIIGGLGDDCVLETFPYRLRDLATNRGQQATVAQANRRDFAKGALVPIDDASPNPLGAPGNNHNLAVKLSHFFLLLEFMPPARKSLSARGRFRPGRR